MKDAKAVSVEEELRQELAKAKAELRQAKAGRETYLKNARVSRSISMPMILSERLDAEAKVQGISVNALIVGGIAHLYDIELE